MQNTYDLDDATALTESAASVIHCFAGRVRPVGGGFHRIGERH